ncbi:MAG: hypothetical protein QOI82_1560 [Actinomycetota bacterium]|jgi:LPXTG-motif cell wall-anchored protein|nr:hypothetical protein [Actinomycetota bacterium]
MVRMLTRATTAALMLSGVLLASSAAPAVAAPAPHPCKASQGKPPYPPGQCKKGSVSNPNAHPGEQQVAFSGDGEFDPGSTVRGENHSKVQQLGTTTADQMGGATFTFTIPQDADNGSHEVLFFGTLDGQAHQASVMYTVSRGKVGTKSTETTPADNAAEQPPAAGAPGAPAAPAAVPGREAAGRSTAATPRSSSGLLHLPRTGAAIFSTGAAGAGALLFGLGLILLGRRRRDTAIAAALPR